MFLDNRSNPRDQIGKIVNTWETMRSEMQTASDRAEVQFKSQLAIDAYKTMKRREIVVRTRRNLAAYTTENALLDLYRSLDTDDRTARAAIQDSLTLLQQSEQKLLQS